MKTDFLIGWLSKAPKSFARAGLWFGIVGMVIGLSFVAVSSMQQQTYTEGAFEFGEFTEIKGILDLEPIPTLRIASSEHAPIGQRIILVDYGKFGAESTLAEMEKAVGTKLQGIQVTLRGTLIYWKQQVLLELTEKAMSLVDYQKGVVHSSFQTGKKASQQVTGEVIDPKCYFGAMNPGSGKTHMGCAIRCVEGGIPAMLNDPEKGYFVLLNEQGLKMPADQIKNFIGRKTTAKGLSYQKDNVQYLEVSQLERP